MSWEIRRDGVVVCCGEKSPPPSREECKRFHSDGYRVYIDGKETKSGKDR